MKGWQYKTLKDSSLLVTDGDWIESKDQSSSGIRLIQTGNIGVGCFKSKDDKPHYISEDTFERLGCTEIYEGDCLISRLPEPVGRGCLVPKTDDRMITAVDCSIIRFKDIMRPQFFIYYSQSAKYLQDILNHTTGTTRKRISRKNLEGINIPVPPIAEQEKIVAELDCLSGIIEKKKQQLKELDALAQSIFYELFGDPIENDKGWDVQLFSTACDVITDFVAAGSFADIKQNVQYKENQDYAQLVRTTDLKNRFTKGGFVYVTESAFKYLWRVNLNQECIILPNVGVNCGEVYYVNPSMLPYSNNVLGPNAILVRSTKENHRYLSALFMTSYFQCQLEGIVNAVGQPKFNKTELKKLEVIVPPLTLQQDFASKIEAIEKQKELIKQSILETETLFNSRMDYYFN